MDIETINITPKDNIGKRLNEAKEISELNNMPVLIKLIDRSGKCGGKDKAYLVSRDYFVEIVGHIYKKLASDSVGFSDRGEYVDEKDNPDFDRLKSLINSLYENSFGSGVFTGSIVNPETAEVNIELFPAIDSKSSISETIYTYESGQLDDISIEDQTFLDKGYYSFLQFKQATYKIEPTSKAKKQLDEYKSAKNGKSSLRRIALIEEKLTVNPMYKENHFERLIGNYKGLFSRRINGKDRYVYGVLNDQPRRIIVHSVRGHYN